MGKKEVILQSILFSIFLLLLCLVIFTFYAFMLIAGNIRMLVNINIHNPNLISVVDYMFNNSYTSNDFNINSSYITSNFLEINNLPSNLEIYILGITLGVAAGFVYILYSIVNLVVKQYKVLLKEIRKIRS